MERQSPATFNPDGKGIKMKNKAFLFFLFFCLLSLLAVQAQNDFEAGNAAYQNKEWAKAADYYRKAAQNGLNNAQLWYNAGCAEWQNGTKALAALYFLRSARIDPRDADLRHNLKLILGEQPEASFQETLLSLLSLNELLILTLILNWGFFLFLLFFLKTRKEFLAWTAGIFLLGFIIIGAATGAAVYDRVKTPQAVILPEKVTVYSGPGRDFTDCAQLPQAGLVKVIKNQDDWCEISFASGQRGWIRSEELEKV